MDQCRPSEIAFRRGRSVASVGSVESKRVSRRLPRRYLQLDSTERCEAIANRGHEIGRAAIGLDGLTKDLARLLLDRVSTTGGSYPQASRHAVVQIADRDTRHRRVLVVSAGLDHQSDCNAIMPARGALVDTDVPSCTPSAKSSTASIWWDWQRRVRRVP